MITLLVIGAIGLLALIIWGETDKQKCRAKMAATLLQQYKIEGSRQDTQYLCDKLLTDEELLQQLLRGDSDITFGSGGRLQLKAVPEFNFVGDNMVLINNDSKRYELVRMDYGKQQVVRISEIGPRGGIGKSIQISEYELLVALAGLSIIREDYSATKR